MKIPGSLYQRNTRWYWRVRLPGCKQYKVFALKPKSCHLATKDRGTAVECAKIILRDHISPQSEGEYRTVRDLCGLYTAYADKYYIRPDGTKSKESQTIRYALNPLLDRFGDCLAEDLGPVRLTAVRDAMVASKELCRREINRRIGIIKRMFKWASSREYIHPSVYWGVQSVGNLTQTRGDLYDLPKRKGVEIRHVVAVLPFTTPVIADMIKIQFYTGMRPDELCMMKPCRVIKDRDIWVYDPERHKTQYRGKERHIYIGPKAQAVLAAYLDRDGDRYCFSPAESEAQRKAIRRKQRKSKVYKKPKPDKRHLSDHYDTMSYGKAVKWAVGKARKAIPAIPYWTPYQLRHTLATMVRSGAGLEESSAVLGNDIEVAKIYAERLERVGMDTAARFG